MTEYHNLHVRWALSLQPGDKVLTNWTEGVPEYQSLAFGTVEPSNIWRQVEVEKVWADDTCDSGFLVTLKDCDQDSAWKYQLDIDWIKPLPNPITLEIIEIVQCSLNSSYYKELAHLSDIELVKEVVDCYTIGEWNSRICVHELLWQAEEVHEDSFPQQILKALITTAVPLIDWEDVVADKTVAERLKELRGKK